MDEGIVERVHTARHLEEAGRLRERGRAQAGHLQEVPSCGEGAVGVAIGHHVLGDAPGQSCDVAQQGGRRPPRRSAVAPFIPGVPVQMAVASLRGSNLVWNYLTLSCPQDTMRLSKRLLEIECSTGAGPSIAGQARGLPHSEPAPAGRDAPAGETGRGSAARDTHNAHGACRGHERRSS